MKLSSLALPLVGLTLLISAQALADFKQEVRCLQTLSHQLYRMHQADKLGTSSLDKNVLNEDGATYHQESVGYRIQTKGQFLLVKDNEIFSAALPANGKLWLKFPQSSNTKVTDNFQITTGEDGYVEGTSDAIGYQTILKDYPGAMDTIGPDKLTTIKAKLVANPKVELSEAIVSQLNRMNSSFINYQNLPEPKPNKKKPQIKVTRESLAESLSAGCSGLENAEVQAALSSQLAAIRTATKGAGAAAPEAVEANYSPAN